MSNGELMAISPVDGRYASRAAELAPLVSEYGLIRNRVLVETAWLGVLGSGILPGKEALAPESVTTLHGLSENFSEADAERIKEIESKVNHDVKAVELWLRERLEEDGSFEEYIPLIHFGCTSEDINNLAYALMLKQAREDILLPAIDSIGKDLEAKAHEYADIPLLSRTHGQPASPTTLGKEMAVFVDKLSRTANHLGSVAILGKFNGATGNYSAASTGYPEVDWQAISKEFVESFGLEFNPYTTQIEPHDWMARYFNELALTNTLLINLCRDMWQYIGHGVFKLSVVTGEVGSSTMPHKVNPIDFENAEANFGVANSVLNHLAEKLPISRLQRDLSDSAAQRAIGPALAHALVGYKSLKKGLGKVAPDKEMTRRELNENWEVLAEPIVAVMRRYGISDAYEILKELSRGEEFSVTKYRAFVRNLDVSPSARDQLMSLTPAKYIGRAADLAKAVKYTP